MKVGNVSQTVLKRSVLKQLHTKRKEILTDLSVEEMCTAVQIRDTEDVVFASAVVSGNSKNILYALAAARAKGLKTVALTGRDGGKLAKSADAAIIVPCLLYTSPSPRDCS